MCFGRLLRSAGHDVIEVRDGTEALALLNHWRVSLVITDLSLPNLNGLNLASFIRARWPKMPVVVISGYFSQEAGNIILDGVADFLATGKAIGFSSGCSTPTPQIATP